MRCSIYGYVCRLSHSVLSNSVIPRTVVCQTPLSMGFSRQEHWDGLSFPTPENLPNLGIESESPESPTLAGGCFTTESLGKPSIRGEIPANEQTDSLIIV